jgi:hypothetical protein
MSFYRYPRKISTARDKNWNIKGIAESVIKEIKEEREDGEDEEYLDNVLDYYLQRAYWSVYSKDTADARIVVELVKQYIEEKEGLA